MLSKNNKEHVSSKRTVYVDLVLILRHPNMKRAKQAMQRAVVAIFRQIFRNFVVNGAI
jgi:hypothetical protein